MATTRTFSLQPGWRVLLRDLGIHPPDVLRRAGLPDDLFAREAASLSTHEYFRLCEGLEVEANDPLLPIRIGKAISFDFFDPTIFTAMCSPNLNIALHRISRFKQLIAPMKLHVAVLADATSAEFEWLDNAEEPPAMLAVTELVFLVQIARMATRYDIHPLQVTTTTTPPEPADAYIEYFGVPVRRGEGHGVKFSAADGERPFLTSNEKMWQFFEPALRKRLSKMDATATTSARVRGTLLELLPSGRNSIEEVAKVLGVSTRTLQRRLRSEKSSFRRELNQTREELALYYLERSDMSGAEISLLLGFKDTNSFYRAFHDWTGKTPAGVRHEVQRDMHQPRLSWQRPV